MRRVDYTRQVAVLRATFPRACEHCGAAFDEHLISPNAKGDPAAWCPVGGRGL